MFKRGKTSEKTAGAIAKPAGSIYVETKDREGLLEIPFTGETTLLRLVLKKGLDISHSCDGNASCGTCRIDVLEDFVLPERNELEQEMASDRGFKAHERLACQVLAKRGLKIRIP